MLCNLARAAALAAMLLAAVPAIAADARSVQVSHADLNLATAAGKAMFDRRVVRASHRVCGVANESLMRLRTAALRCAANAREAARPAIETAYRNAGNRQLASQDVSITVTP